MSAAPQPEAQPGLPLFRERPTELVVRDAYALAAAPLALAGLFGALDLPVPGLLCLAATLFVAAFFRNPPRLIPPGEDRVLAPADGRVIEVGEIEGDDGGKRPRVGIFLSVFDVHVNRAPVAGRVVSVERSGSKFLAAFDRRAETSNVRSAMRLETAQGQRVDVVQITGLIARRIVCHPQPGEWIERGARYGLIRFGSRTDVVLPPGSEIGVRKGERVRGGESEIARLPRSGGEGSA